MLIDRKEKRVREHVPTILEKKTPPPPTPPKGRGGGDGKN